MPNRAWDMGDIPHGWACGRVQLLLRDILCFECDEDGMRRCTCGGVMPHWLGGGRVHWGDECADSLWAQFQLPTDAPAEREASGTRAHPTTIGAVRFVYPCRFGAGVHRRWPMANPVPVLGRMCRYRRTTQVTVTYQ